MAEMTITRQFNADHGTNSILSANYHISVTISGPIILGFVDHCDSKHCEEMIDAVCMKLEGCYLDALMGRATHEMVALWLFNCLELEVERIVVESEGLTVTVTREEYLKYDFEALILLHKAMSAFHRLDLIAAERYIDLSIQTDMSNGAAYLVRGRIYRYTERYELALEDFFKVISFFPQWSEGYRNVGNMYLFLKKYKEMISFFEKAVQLCPNSSLAQNNLGYAYSIIGDYEHGYIYCSKAVELKQDYREAHMDLANICEALHKDEEAIRHRAIANSIENQYVGNKAGYVLADVESYCFFDNCC